MYRLPNLPPRRSQWQYTGLGAALRSTRWAALVASGSADSARSQPGGITIYGYVWTDLKAGNNR